MTSERKPCYRGCLDVGEGASHDPDCPNAQNFKGCLPECRPFDHAPECSAPEEWRRKLAEPGDVRYGPFGSCAEPTYESAFRVLEPALGLSCEDPACDLPRNHRPPHPLTCGCGHRKQSHELYEDHEECIECEFCDHYQPNAKPAEPGDVRYGPFGDGVSMTQVFVDSFGAVCAERDALAAEVERLREENGGLKNALRLAMEGVSHD